MSPALTVTLIGLAGAALALVVLERGSGGTQRLALVAALGAVAAAGRVLFAPVPSVQPVTVICLATGATLGARAGAAVGALAPLISNAFLGQGPWTPAQMALWAAVGASGALLGRAASNPLALASAAAAWGIAFGWAMNAWFLAVFGPELSIAALLVTGARSLPFDIAHVVGNVLIALLVGPALVRMLRRYAARTGISSVLARAPAAASVGDRVVR